MNHHRGELWTIESLTEHAEKISNGTVNSKTYQDVMGVKSKPVMTSIPVVNHVTSLLHITIGKGNDFMTNLKDELQAAAETYTEGYLQAEKDISTSSYKLKESRDELARFLMVNREYISELKRKQRGIQGLQPQDREVLINELEEMDEEQTLLQAAVDEQKKKLSDAKETLAKEKKIEANTKAFGQPVHAKLDEILFEHGIDRSGMFGGAIDGNACRKLMAHAESIINEIRDFVLQQESRIAGITDEAISDVCAAHIAYLQALDGYISGMSTKRFHLTPRIAEQTEKHRDKCLEIERYLQLSITPKSHVMDAHSCEQQQLFKGIGDLEESFGERNHQLESIADRRYGGTRDFAEREKIKSREQAQFNHPDVQAKISNIKEKRKVPVNSRTSTAVQL
jgi:hypothetical protein